MTSVPIMLLIAMGCAESEPDGRSTVSGAPPPPAHETEVAPGPDSERAPAQRLADSVRPREPRAGAVTTIAQPPVDPRPQEQDTIRARYPKEWEVAVPPGTPLDSLRRELDRQIDILPARDLEDQTPLPIWFRVYLRKHNPGLPTDGPYQYPRTAPRLLRWILAHPDSVGSAPDQ